MVVAQVSQRGEGNSGGIGEGMQYQKKLKADPNMRGDPNYEMQINSQLKNPNEFGNVEAKHSQLYGQDGEGDMLLNPMDINEPIEGILISEEEKRIAPILQITIMEGM